MKKIIYLSLVLPLLIFSCESMPEAQFSVDTIEPEVGQQVFFTNESENAVEFEWDFGDGFISNEVHPSHIYTGTGTFEVILTIFSNNGSSDKATITIEVMIPTLLEIEVLEYYDKYVVPNASVRLYPTLPDWDDQTNMESEGYTNANGKVVFSNLGPYVYYVDVWEESHDNVALRGEDVGFIRTPEILPHEINWFVAYVDIVDHGKGEGRRDRKIIIKSIERKIMNMNIPARDSGTQDWQELYNQSIRLK
ncbi:MAG: PKD domain-containing protein [Bacteroidales bacterium]|nr:PKD domain-containing protein [Bacteroidales bacterium]